jgi:DNA-binding MarR family transcriptional regulator/N-acetylglutamate synthase-like GNAT family acetyltransferase
MLKADIVIIARSDTMKDKESHLVSEIRSFNRFYTSILGLLDRHILESPYSLTEVRILLEINKMKECTANKLISKLAIDRGYMSRVLKRFEANGLIVKENSATDRRITILCLTVKGKQILFELEDRSAKQVERLISHLSDNEQQKLADAMKDIKSALLDGINPVIIRSYQPTDLEYIINRHRELYDAEYGFGSEFSDYVEKYVLKFDEHHDESKENIWIAEADGKPIGMIAIVRADESTAQLRWFLIEPHMRGIGLGYKLMKTAVDFCKEKNYTHVFLWTVSILEAARSLYKQFGFELTESKVNESWGEHLMEERWDLDLQIKKDSAL